MSRLVSQSPEIVPSKTVQKAVMASPKKGMAYVKMQLQIRRMTAHFSQPIDNKLSSALHSSVQCVVFATESDTWI
uniref:Dynein light chain n=1 Tax=Ascaris lumbricoides TaxID=6252 RepID=A0A0M3HR62_ASCLU